jgi:hypothetical protein
MNHQLHMIYDEKISLYGFIQLCKEKMNNKRHLVEFMMDTLGKWRWQKNKKQRKIL